MEDLLATPQLPVILAVCAPGPLLCLELTRNAWGACQAWILGMPHLSPPGQAWLVPSVPGLAPRSILFRLYPYVCLALKAESLGSEF